MQPWTSYANSGGKWMQSKDGGWYWHGAPSSTSNSWASWTCQNCNQTNWVPKQKCSQCGMKKSWAQVVAQPPTPPQQAGNGKSVNPIQSQLEKVSILLQRVTPEAADAPTQSAPSPQHQSTPATPTRTQIVAMIKSAEASLACLSEDDIFAEQRQALTDKIASLRQDIVDAKPIGARIDGARAFLSRAQERRENAANAMEIAKAAMEAADEEIDKVTQELLDLESALAKAPQPPASDSPLDALASHLEVVLAELSVKDALLPEQLQNCQEHARTLLEGMRKSYGVAKANLGEDPGMPRRRMRGKHTPLSQIPTYEDIRMRQFGKQAPKRTMMDYFQTAVPVSSKKQKQGFQAPQPSELRFT